MARELEEPPPSLERTSAESRTYAPTRSEAELLGELRHAMDAAFLPRPLRRVDALPRNETG